MITIEEIQDTMEVGYTPHDWQSSAWFDTLVQTHWLRAKDLAKYDVITFLMGVERCITTGKAALIKQDDLYYAEVRVDSDSINAKLHDILYSVEDLNATLPIAITGFEESLCILLVGLTRETFLSLLGESECV